MLRTSSPLNHRRTGRAPHTPGRVGTWPFPALRAEDRAFDAR
jgi:hypothetical protein